MYVAQLYEQQGLQKIYGAQLEERPRLITETQIPVTTIFNRNGELKTTCSLVFLRDFILLPVQKDHIPIIRHVESIRKKTTVWGVAPSL